MIWTSTKATVMSAIQPRRFAWWPTRSRINDLASGKGRW